MKSIRFYTLAIEGAMVLALIFTVVLVLKMLEVQLVRAITDNQHAQIIEIDQYLNNQLDQDQKIFEAFVQKPISQVDQDLPYLSQFSDIYWVNTDYSIGQILKKDAQSVIFEGFQISNTQISTFLGDLALNEIHISPLIRSPERETVSAYMAYRKDDGFMVARLSVDHLKEIMKVIAQARHMIITLASDQGYILSSTADILPFEVVPDLKHQGLVSLEGVSYILVANKLEKLGNNIVLLIPFDRVSSIIRILQITAPIVLAILLIFILIKTEVYHRLISKPLMSFSQNLATWQGGEIILYDGSDVLKTKELRVIADVFNDKSTEINLYIEELQDLNQEIENREARYRDLVENVDDLMYAFNEFGELQTVNVAFETTFGIDRKSVLGADSGQGTHLFDYIHDIHSKDHIPELFQALKLTNQRMEFSYCTKDAQHKTVYFKVIWIPRINERGNLYQVLATQSNVTALMNAQESLKRIFETETIQLKRMVNEKEETITNILEELVEKEKLASLTNLVSGIAHEINTPLGVSVLANSFMQSTYNDLRHRYESNQLTQSNLREFLDTVGETITILNTNLGRSSELIRSFKEIAVSQRLEELELMHLEAFINTVLLSLKHEYKHMKVQFNIECDPLLEFISYPGAISQILTNLIMNAIKHGFREKEGGTIGISITKKDQVVTLVFSDDGIGMAAEVSSRIFEPFFTTSRGKGGSGLGMNIVYNLVNGLLKGKITCDSAMGKGTRFEIQFRAD